MILSKIINPLLLFQGKEHPKKMYHDLVKKYHPDHNPKADPNDIIHINRLWDMYQDKTKLNLPEDVMCIKRENYYTSYISRDKVKFEFDSFVDLSNFSQLPDFRSMVPDKVYNEFKRVLVTNYITDGYKYTVKLPTSNAVPLSLLMEQYPNGLPPKQVAWIVGWMLNLACLFSISDIQYGGFLIKNLWIDMDEHMLYPVGGWWCCAPRGHKFKILDQEVIGEFPTNLLKATDGLLDLHMIKYTTRVLLGNPMPVDLKKMVPPAFFKWLTTPPIGKVSIDNPAIAEYEIWDKVLIDSYDKRKFLVEKYDKELIFNHFSI